MRAMSANHEILATTNRGAPLHSFAGSRSCLPALALSALCLVSCEREEPRDRRSGRVGEKPNLIVILADDMGYGDVAALNPESRIPTPNLDRLAAEGLVFADAHSSGSYCVPSRYGLMTGRYLWRTRLGSGGNMANFSGTLIEPGRTTLPERLRAEGYYTGLVGKWHLGIDWRLHDESEREVIRDHPNYQNFDNIDFGSPVLKGIRDFGFEYSFALNASAEMNPSTFLENNRVVAIPTLSTEEVKKERGEWYGRDDNLIAEGFTMDGLVPAFSDKACEFLETAARTRPDQPFFLYYALTSPHNPIVPNPEFVGASEAGAYGDFVVELDHHVGRLLEKLQTLGLAEHTLVIFTSDNGQVDRTRGYSERWVRGDPEIHGHRSHGSLSGWKGGLGEGAHRMPFLVRWPGRVRAGEVCDTTISHNDLLPTFAEMLGIPLDDDTAEDGISFFRALIGEERPPSFHEAIVHNRNDGTFAIRQGDYKLIVEGPKTIPEVLDATSPKSFRLYDLVNDLGETEDLSGREPARVDEMHELLQKYLREERSVPRLPPAGAEGAWVPESRSANSALPERKQECL